jgi:nucleotide sugar dehydrogenase
MTPSTTEKQEPIAALRTRLREGEALVGVVGIGYIGFSTAVYYARKGIRVVGYDVDEVKVAAFNRGENYIDNIQFWVGFDFKHLVSANLVSASTNEEVLGGCDAIFVCVPTERNGDPYMDILASTVKTLAAQAKKDALVIVESTLTPGTAEELVVKGFKDLKRPDIKVAIAPRRDWFVDSGRNLTDIPRVVGGSTPEATEMAKDVLGLVCQTVLPASSHREAELIKSCENAYRHMDIVLANQLTFAYPDVNMREVLQLVGTKWNMNVYYPNLGVGGYCIAPASKYVQGGTTEEIPLLKEATRFTDEMTGKYADLMKRFDKIGVLGIAYKGALKVHVLSPGVRLVEELIKRKKHPVVNDPMYEMEEAQSVITANGTPLRFGWQAFPAVLKNKDLIVIAADHPEYVVPTSKLREWISPGTTVLDIYGIWKQLDLEKHIEGLQYVLLGSQGWIDRLEG